MSLKKETMQSDASENLVLKRKIDPWILVQVETE
jgi:hypothetical protein